MAWTSSLAGRPAYLALATAALLAALALAWGGLGEPLDQVLREARFRATDRAPSGQTLFVEIDSESMAAIGVWPWPRRVHAQVLDRLMQLGAAEVVFDVDFSATSNPEDDAAFQKALERAGGYALLAAFQQVTRGGTVMLNAPLARFAAHSEPVLVNVDGDGTALLRSVPSGLPEHGLRSVAAALAPGTTVPGPTIAIDYGIDLARIDRISVSELLAGDPDPKRFENKQVVVGASAIELRDFFRVPRFGVVPGPLVQLAATETLKARRALTNLGFFPAIAAAAVAAALFGFSFWRLSLASRAYAALLAMIAVEAVAWFSLSRGGFSVDTAAFHLCLVILLLVGLLYERALHWRQIQQQQLRLA
ncbi:MAG: CHASE2 domain-containing protein, partial [Pseudomonas sp.]